MLPNLDPDVWRWGRDSEEPDEDDLSLWEDEEDAGDEDGDPDDLYVEGEPVDEMQWLRSYIETIHHRL